MNGARNRCCCIGYRVLIGILLASILVLIAKGAGDNITKPHKAFRTIRAAAKLDDDVTPHVLRHTRATWLAKAGIDAHEAAASLGLTVEEFERTYSRASPDFQQSAANAF